MTLIQQKNICFYWFSCIFILMSLGEEFLCPGQKVSLNAVPRNDGVTFMLYPQGLKETTVTNSLSNSVPVTACRATSSYFQTDTKNVQQDRISLVCCTVHSTPVTLKKKSKKANCSSNSKSWCFIGMNTFNFQCYHTHLS